MTAYTHLPFDNSGNLPKKGLIGEGADCPSTRRLLGHEGHRAGITASISLSPSKNQQDRGPYLLLQLLLGLCLTLPHTAGRLPIYLLPPLLLGVLRGQRLSQQARRTVAPLVAALWLGIAPWGRFLQGDLSLSWAIGTVMSMPLFWRNQP